MHAVDSITDLLPWELWKLVFAHRRLTQVLEHLQAIKVTISDYLPTILVHASTVECYAWTALLYDRAEQMEDEIERIKSTHLIR